MNPFEFVLAIIVIATIGSILKARLGGRSRQRIDGDDGRPVDSAETRRLQEEVRALKDRLQVLERITVEKENTLSREIEQLRDR
ncbi:MAG: hypothetical protein LH465_03100 [Sphingomonas bacterium]|nr:hypothetical protein [Sphingomonas bacterium]